MPARNAGHRPYSAALLADCGSTIGLGHLRRCLVLAAALGEAGLRARIATPENVGDAMIDAAGIATLSWPKRSQDLAPHDVLVVDHYGIDAEILASWRSQATLRVVLDDLADHPIDADLILNQNLFAHQLDYDAIAACPVLRGPAYALVDPAFPAIAGDRRRKANRAIVSFGGSDDGALGLRAAQALRKAGFAGPIDIVISPLRAMARDLENASVLASATVHRGAAMASLMARAFLYVGGAGTTIFEAAAAGLAMLPVAIAKNQFRSIEAQRSHGIDALIGLDDDRLVAASRRLIAEPARGVLRDVVAADGPTRVVRHIVARLVLRDPAELSARP